jgi:hypothetical protein
LAAVLLRRVDHYRLWLLGLLNVLGVSRLRVRLLRGYRLWLNNLGLRYGHRLGLGLGQLLLLLNLLLELLQLHLVLLELLLLQLVLLLRDLLGLWLWLGLWLGLLDDWHLR